MMRMSGFVFFNPMFTRDNIPRMVQTGLVMLLSILVITTKPAEDIVVFNLLEYAFLLMKEFAVGAVIGFMISLYSYIVILAGDFMDMQMGMSMAKVFDAQSNASLSLSSTYFNILYMLLFFAMDAHIALIHLILTSYEILPYGQVTIDMDVGQAVLDIFISCSKFGLRLALPIVALEFLDAMGMGMLMKTIPQINVFVVDVQMKILVGLMLLGVFSQPMADFLQKVITLMIDNIGQIFYVLL